MVNSEWVEELKVEGRHVADEVKRLLHEGNVQHIVIKHGDQKILEVPVTIGVVAATLAPVLAAVAALGGVLTHCTLEVRRSGVPPV